MVNVFVRILQSGKMRAKKVLYIIVYDVVSDRRRSRISQILEKYGLRVNYSVFECMFTDAQLLSVQQKIGKLMVPQEDTVIYYPCCVNCFTKILYQPCRRIAGNVVLVK